ncbi:S41 family peptidase [Christiangramia salexigens]|uniref:Peptidase S41 n=1 Tax=Christiangramia salexigens TaxID=1913577 RepID=A0A1L3J3M0_9FLAO|nr:S41 family peptidase [Christiangramia salexigens]APG59710.1 peptidase S41 [Christiangramia salexigens]
MKFFKYLTLLFVSATVLTSCSKDEDDIANPKPSTGGEMSLELEIKDFVWEGMNEIYLYKSDIPELRDSFDDDQNSYFDYLNQFESPEDLFYDGLVANQDRFSFIVDDYVELENNFAGISKTTGMNFRLSYEPNSSSELFGFVRYVSPNTPAKDAGITRGTLFSSINGEQLTLSNYQNLLNAETYVLGLAKLEGDNIIDTGETVEVSKIEYTSNPVFIAKTIETNGIKVGYLMYNSYTADFDDELNAAFADFKAANISELVLDLRYNGGGSVESSVDLASMITGQFEGEVFAQQQWNQKYQNYFLNNNPDRLYDYFNTEIRTGEKINSLNLTKVYIIGTGSTASASELTINGLRPYIDVVHVGTNTVGKFQASVTLYDSPNFGKDNANPDHKYAIQPLVYKSENANGVSDFVDGLTPDIVVQESIRNYGVLGDPNEKLLAAALADINGNRRAIQFEGPYLKEVTESGADQLDYQRMYIDDVPQLKRNDQ